MTKDTYFEMCAMLGEEPIEEEIPVDINDLPILVQQCFSIYGILEDRWDTMGGGYLGKNYVILFELFKIHGIEDNEATLALTFLQQMDSIRSKIVSEKVKSKSS